MSKNKLFVITAYLCLEFLLVKSANAQKVPIKSLGLYSDYRKEIINTGWKPTKANMGYPWPELMCGSGFCTATFISADGKEELILYVWGNTTSEGKTYYYLAPSFDIHTR